MAKLDVKQIENKDNRLTLQITNITPTQINTIRRTIMDYVPVMAMEDIELRKNSSILYDEAVAHRLGLIPLATDLSSYNIPKDCSCEGAGCAKCQLQLTLKAKGPKVVYAESIKSKDPKVVPIYPKMPIVKLAEGQEIELIATAMLGLGKEHSKWSPGTAWYSNVPKITVNDKSKRLEEFKDKYPKEIFTKEGKIDKKALDDPKILDACEDVCEEIIKIEYIPDSFIFYLESWGSLKPKEILMRAADELKSKFDELSKTLKATS